MPDPTVYADIQSRKDTLIRKSLQGGLFVG